MVLDRKMEMPMATPTDRPAVVMRIGKRWNPEMDVDDGYDAARGWWVIGPKRDRCEYAIAVAHGVVCDVYRIRRLIDCDPSVDPNLRMGAKVTLVSSEVAHTTWRLVRQLALQQGLAVATKVDIPDQA